MPEEQNKLISEQLFFSGDFLSMKMRPFALLPYIESIIF